MSKSKRIQVAFTESQWDLISCFRGEFGEGDADIVRNIVLAWLAEKSMITSTVKNKIIQKNMGGHDD
ncbi:CopG family transcriptional regulator [Methanocrinis sp.]|uniref:CopG family transcriptional regulator n=1 Tax=Methanocrinis sp. TaxID=3101522 RepID=UPI003D0B7C3B